MKSTFTAQMTISFKFIDEHFRLTVHLKLILTTCINLIMHPIQFIQILLIHLTQRPQYTLTILPLPQHNLPMPSTSWLDPCLKHLRFRQSPTRIPINIHVHLPPILNLIPNIEPPQDSRNKQKQTILRNMNPRTNPPPNPIRKMIPPPRVLLRRCLSGTQIPLLAHPSLW